MVWPGYRFALPVADCAYRVRVNKNIAAGGLGCGVELFAMPSHGDCRKAA